MGLFSSDKEEDKDSSEEKKYYCDTCGKEISKEEFEENGGQCFNCIHVLERGETKLLQKI